MSDRTVDHSTIRSETPTLDPAVLTGGEAPNGAHRWIRLAGLAGAMGNDMGQGLLEHVGSWASTPYWKKGTALDPEVAKANSDTPDLLVRREAGRVVVVRAPAGYQDNALMVDILFEDAGATTCAPYEVVTAADPNYVLYLVLLLDRKGEDWTRCQPELSDLALRVLAPGDISYGVPPDGENSLNVEASYPLEWEGNEGGEDLWGEDELSPMMAGMEPGPWAPPGKQPVPLYVGREVHKVIAVNYRMAHPGETVAANDFPMHSILDAVPGAASNKLSEQERLLKPDIANLTRLHLYEIKSEAEAPAGAAKLVAYLGAFHAAGVPIVPGPASEPGTTGVLPAPGGYVLYHCLSPGLIVYRYRRSLPAPVPVGVPAPEGARELIRRITDWRYWEELTGLTGTALLLYLLVSEGSRVVPGRNLLPVP